MKQIPTWQRPKTSRVYLQPVYAGRLVSLYPDMKVTDLELSDRPKHFDQSGFGVHLLCGNDQGDLNEFDMEQTKWQRPEGGSPIYVLHNTDRSGCLVTMTAFCDAVMQEGTLPFTYVCVKVKNDTDRPVTSVLGLLPRYSDKDHYLTGLHDTGYESYDPNVGQWYLCWKKPFTAVDPLLSEEVSEALCREGDGWMKVLFHSGTLKWVSRTEQKNRFKAHDCFVVCMDLEPGQEGEVGFVISRKQPAKQEMFSGRKAYEEALQRTASFWKDIQSRVRILPGAKRPIADMSSSEAEDMFRQSITVSLQMLAVYDENKDMVYARQGDVGRYLWVWEAVQYLTLLDRVGLSEYAEAPYRMWLDKWQLKEGEEKGKLLNPYVDWANTNGAFLAGLSFHLLTVDDPKRFASFREGMELAFDYIRYRRDPEKAGEGEVPGLFTAGKASDWNEVGQHWTYTDAVNVKGLEWMTRCCEHYVGKGVTSEEAKAIRDVYEEYRQTVEGVLHTLEKGHEQEEAYVMPHILGVPFEESYNHCFYTDGEPYLLKLGMLDPLSRTFEQMENFYRESGFLDDEHGLAGRMTNDDCGSPGLYGHVYYTGVPEVCWVKAWQIRGETEKAEKYARGILNYNVTPEYITSERYCSVDPWFTPWQPNGSGAGRLGHFMLDYFGERSAT